ncbi:hypothetical protein [Peribacillus asahii]|uniref:hypothetical protein n=1 Tax=Peribacillus asahii TaxID=228899 RepID=UPI00207A0389|nr:hypothetical protein [Peribacillus asahii]USK61333.1 hypothetical protein LIT37_08460 [Peribacillus asahii]
MKFTSEKYPELGFYVDGERKKFVNGVYEANTKKEQEVLSNLKGVTKVAEKKTPDDK